MAAPRHVSDRQIIEALQKWQGNVTAAAEEVRLSRRQFYERASGLGLDLDRLRPKGNVPSHPTNSDAVKKQSEREATGVPQSSVVTFPKSANAPTLVGMQSAETEMSRRPKRGPIRLRPDQAETLREAKFDFQAKHRVEAGESDLLQRFFDETFPEWLKRCLGRAKTQEPGK
jgi:regulatory Fis family protein